MCGIRILFVLLLCSFKVYAADLTLFEAYQRASTYDASILAARANNMAEREEINKSFAGFLPQARISAFQGQGKTDSTTPAGSTSISRHTNYDSYNYNFSVRQSIYNKANIADYRGSKAQVAKSDAVLEKEKITLITRVSGAYLDVLLAHENIDYSRSQIESVTSQLNQAERRYESGLGTITEISESKANLETAIAKSLEWSNAFELAKRELENYIGNFEGQLLRLDPKKLNPRLVLEKKMDDWIVVGLDKNPEVVAAKHDLEILNQDIEKNLAGHYPTLDLVASRVLTESDTNYTIGSSYRTSSLGLQLNVPIFSGGYVNASVNQARYKLNESEEKLKEKQRSISNDIRKYFNEVNNNVARIKAFEESLKSNEIALTGTKKGYEAALRSNVDVLNAEEKFVSAKRDLAKERYQLIFNILQLKLSAGSLNENDIQEVSHWLTRVNS